MIRTGFVALFLPLLAVGPATAAKPTVRSPNQTLRIAAPLIYLKAADLTPTHRLWKNRVTPQYFMPLGKPRLVTIQGIRAVEFGGREGYRGPRPPTALCGNSPRSIAVWAYKPAVKSAAGTMVAWGRRGGPQGSEMSFGWGADPQFGAATHWADDMGWPTPPAPGQWHYLVYTYNGTTAKIYDNGRLRGRLPIHLNTHRAGHLEIGVQNGDRNRPDFHNSGLVNRQIAIASIRIFAAALTPAQIRTDFLQRKSAYHAHKVRTQVHLLLKKIDTFRLKHLELRISAATGEALSLRTPARTGRAGFEFLLWKKRFIRAHNGYYLLGDLTLQTRISGRHSWHFFSSADHRTTARLIHMKSPEVLSAADITSSMGENCPVGVIREWTRSPDGNLAMTFIVRNHSTLPVTIGSIGAAMIFNSDYDNLQRTNMYRQCTYVNPYIGGNAGYLRISRFNGRPPMLYVLPGPQSGFEAYRPLSDDRDAAWPALGAMQEWLVHSLSYCRTSWKNAQPWNQGTAVRLAPGARRTFTWLFIVANRTAASRRLLPRHRMPVAFGVPGYVVAVNVPAKLFLNPPAPVSAITISPRSALRVAPITTRAPAPWIAFNVYGDTPGRARLTIHFADGQRQFIHYFVIPPERKLLRRFGRFLVKHEWYTDIHDPFHRTDSFMPWDNFTHQLVLQHAGSIWMVGLSDEMGAGPNLAAAMKNLYLPNRRQIQDLEIYVNHALWGRLQQKNYGVRRSQFYFDPHKFPHYYTISNGGFMGPEAQAHAVWRAFNYPHQAAVYWCLYRLARYHTGLVTSRPWRWYLRQAYRTIMAQRKFAPDPDGLMDGDIYLSVIKDLHREGMLHQYARLLAFEKQRLAHWLAVSYPYGSEMPWDSTGEPDVYLTARFFHAGALARQALRCTLAFDPSVPNWGYDGAGYRYFDELVNGTQWPHIARLLQHYGGGINANSLLAAYRSHPSDTAALRTGYAGTLGALTDIAPNGFGSQCFDGDPAIMQFDPYVGDYGLEFYGFVRSDAAYITHNHAFGWLGYGCSIQRNHGRLLITMHDGLHHRLYIAPLHLFVKCFAGHISAARFNPAIKRLTLFLAPAGIATPRAFLRLKMLHRGKAMIESGKSHPVKLKRGMAIIPLGSKTTKVIIVCKSG